MEPADAPVSTEGTAAERWLALHLAGLSDTAVPGQHVLCLTDGYSPLPPQMADAGRTVDWFLPDLYRAARGNAAAAGRPSLRVICAADPPEQIYDLAVLPTVKGGQAELTRDLLQAAVMRLPVGGRLLTAVDHRRDTWLGQQVRKLPGHVRDLPGDAASGYLLTKGSDKLRQRDFRCQFAFRDRGRLIQVVSRPGVFSHRRIDPGARRLIDAMQIPAGSRVLEIGCGTGTVTLAAALRADDVRVHAVDTHARAVQCTADGAALNGVQDRVTTQLAAEGPYGDDGRGYDIVLSNPPYYADLRIAWHFLTSARAALRSGGRIWTVGKRPEWFAQRMDELFHSVDVTDAKGYCIATGLA